MLWAPAAGGALGAGLGIALALPLARALCGEPMRRALAWGLVASSVGLGLLFAALGPPSTAQLALVLGLWIVGLWLGRAFLGRTRLRVLMELRGALWAWGTLLGLAAVFALAPPGVESLPDEVRLSDAEDRTDMLVIVVSGLRPDQLGAGQTPALDALAADSVVFERAYTNAPGGRAALASVLMGVEPSGHGLGAPGARLADGALPLVELLAESGQVSFAVLADPSLLRVSGLLRGFRVFEAPLPGAMLGATPGVSSLWAYDAMCRVRDARGGWSADKHRTSAEVAVDLVLAQMRSASTRRWFGLVQLADLEDPWLPHREAPRADAIVDELHAGLQRIDVAVARLVAQLDALGTYDRTAIVLLADHATLLGEGGLWGGEDALEEARVHVPLLIKLPTRRWAGVRAPWRVRLIDVAPTLLRLAGLPPPPRWRGRDLFGEPELEALDRLALGETWAGDLDRVVLIETSAGPDAARLLRGAGGLRQEVDDARARANAPPPR